MAYRVRVFHTLVLAALGMCLVTYSSLYATSGAFLFMTTGTTLSFNKSSPSAVRPHVCVSGCLGTPSEGAVAAPNVTVSSARNVTFSAARNVTFSSAPTQGAPSVKTTVHVPAAAVLSASNAPSNNTTTRHVALQVIQKIPPKEPVASSAASSSVSTTSSDHTEQGILTRYIYKSGFDSANVELCPDLGRNLKLMIVITSAPGHKDARMAIRQTWGHYSQRNDVNTAFLLGSTEDQHLVQELVNENKLYGDLIRGRFLDSYNNLTLKTVSLLEWVDNYCNNAKFILKTDDDMFINVPKLLSFVEKHGKENRTIFGRLAKKWKPIRNKKSKYYISPSQYQPATFPDFTTGPAYLLTGDVIHDLYNAALGKTYLKLEDVFVTGIVAQDIKVKRTHVSEFFNKRVSMNACSIQKGISVHMVKFHEQFDLWKKLLDRKTKCK